MITLNPELQSLIPPPTAEEYAQLEANILADGCHDPLIVWQEEQCLLDGHNRHAICERHGLEYRIHELSLPSLDAAQAWIIANQLGRRNLTPEQMSYFRGKQYEMQKRQGKRTDLTSHHSDGKSPRTAHVLAAQHKVGTATIERDGAYARAIDTLAEVLGPEARQALLARETKLGQQEVKQLAALAQVSPNTAQEVLASVPFAKTPKTAKQMVETGFQAAKEWVAQVGDGNLAEAGIPRAVLNRFLPAPAALPSPGPGTVHTPLVLEPDEPEADEPPADAPVPYPGRVASGDFEWYTPAAVVDLVRQVLGTIDVDPASCAAAQAVVQARTFYTVEDDGLRHPWHGTVFCNPPYKMPEVARFCGKLREEIAARHTTEAILLVNAATETDWFQAIAPDAAAFCLLDGRLQYVHATRNGEHPCQGQAIFYFGPQRNRFSAIFSTLGMVVTVLVPKATPQLTLAEAPVTPVPQEAPITRETAGSLMQAVWLTVHRLQPCTNAEVKTALGEPRNTVHRALQDLLKQGRARKEGDRYWVIEAPGARGDE